MTGKDLEYCRGCDYMSKGSGLQNTCDYLLLAGHSRGCAPGVGCPYHTGLEAPKRHRHKIDGDKLRELFRQGLSDEEIGAAIGVPEKSVQAYRLKHGLKRPKRRDARPKPVEPQTVAETVLEPAEPEPVPAPIEEVEDEPAEERAELTVSMVKLVIDKLSSFGFGDYPVRVNGRRMKDFRCISLILTDDGPIIDLQEV